jgi:peptide/nickel transport system substrate-binding protein
MACSARDVSRREILRFSALLTGAGALVWTGSTAAAGPQGQITWGTNITLAPTWFDPAETQGLITPYMLMYAMHDAMLKPMPGQPMASSLAESWSSSEDALSYEFVLRKGAKFHNGDDVTADDVKFSFERYRGTASKMLKERVAAVDTLDPLRVRFRLKEPWPDFLTYYVGATGAGWIVPKKYIGQVGDEGFKRAPVGAGPYKFVSFTPGQELILEAFEGYWRKTPSVRRLVFRAIPDDATRVAALKRGEVDIVSLRGELADEVQRTKGLKLQPVVVQVPFWLYFPEQWDPKSPWHDRRVRLAAGMAIDHATISQALTFGHSRITGSIIPDNFEFYWAPPAAAYDPVRAKQLLAEAGYPAGFDAGDYYCDNSFADLAESVINNLQTVGIRTRLRPLERAAFFKEYAEKRLKNVIQGSSGAFGNAATRLEAFVAKGGAYAYGSYPDIDALFREQAVELDVKRREAKLHKIQQLVHERAIYAHIWQLVGLWGVASRVGVSGLGLIPGHAFSAPYEDVTLADK